MIMTVPVCVTQRGNISEGKTPKNDLTSFNVHNISVVVIIFFKYPSRPFARYLREPNDRIRDRIYT